MNSIIFHVCHNVKKTGKHCVNECFSCFLVTQLFSHLFLYLESFPASKVACSDPHTLVFTRLSPLSHCTKVLSV